MCCGNTRLKKQQTITGFWGSPIIVGAEDVQCWQKGQSCSESRILASKHARVCQSCRLQPIATVANPLHEPSWHHLWPFPLARADLGSSATRPEMDEPRSASRLALFQQASSKVLCSLIPLSGPVGMKEGGGGTGRFPTPLSNQSLSKHTKVPLVPKLNHEVLLANAIQSTF